MKIEVEVPNGQKADWVNGVLTLVPVQDTRPVMERIKTFEDAVKDKGLTEADLWWLNDERVPGHIKALWKLEIIADALNEGWDKQQTDGETVYYPWHFLYTKSELENMSKKEQKERCMLNIEGMFRGDLCGFGCAYTYSAPSSTYADVGSRLCLKTRELATYHGQQFIALWAEYRLMK